MLFEIAWNRIARVWERKRKLRLDYWLCFACCLFVPTFPCLLHRAFLLPPLCQLIPENMRDLPHLFLPLISRRHRQTCCLLDGQPDLFRQSLRHWTKTSSLFIFVVALISLHPLTVARRLLGVISGATASALSPDIISLLCAFQLSTAAAATTTSNCFSGERKLDAASCGLAWEAAEIREESAKSRALLASREHTLRKRHYWAPMEAKIQFGTQISCIHCYFWT